ncbi:MAG: hypothetical protein Q8P62_04730 [Candidatus Peregrinibacteria bacterium]|nr:hypothetical protein [Candidatus Peregrinibacteria bacterium]
MPPEKPTVTPNTPPPNNNPKPKEDKEFHTFEQLIFSRTQRVQQKPGETSGQLHERLRPQIMDSFQVIKKPTKVITHSWYTFDTSHILGKDTFVLCTSTCKHETPYQLIVGKRDTNFQKELGDGRYEYTVYTLGKELTEKQKNQIYDEM